ncbi:hypothetical protein C5E16_01715 [Clavibacter michiganensis]|uniref:Secreted protein n=1 Tax=Clavibacter michiganensis TaxID=28447 RepID=A0A2S5VXI2_9MICO|nr:hypothetical protein [Clavibacter michiganensis]PPF70991.1 hypothetical protein C5E16_01715 [Clavibacter michiganensis]
MTTNSTIRAENGPRSTRWALILMAATLGLTGCAADSPSAADLAVLADLDPETSQINLPLEAYAMDAGEQEVVGHANALTMQSCMARSGLPYPRAALMPEESPPFPDRRYGIWSMADATANGFDGPMNATSDAVDAEESALGEGWYSATEVCFRNETMLPMMAPDIAEETVVSKGMNESYGALQRSGVLRDVRAAWVDCMTENGTDVDASTQVLMPDMANPDKRTKEAAIVGATCMDEVGATEQLAGYESRAQLDYIEQHHDELVQYRAVVDKTLEGAREITASFG